MKMRGMFYHGKLKPVTTKKSVRCQHKKGTREHLFKVAKSKEWGSEYTQALMFKPRS